MTGYSAVEIRDAVAAVKTLDISEVRSLGDYWENVSTGDLATFAGLIGVEFCADCLSEFDLVGRRCVHCLEYDEEMGDDFE